MEHPPTPTRMTTIPSVDENSTDLQLQEIKSKPSNLAKNNQTPMSPSKSNYPSSRCNCMRKVCAVFFSNVGLLVAIIIYLIVGCFLFRYLERGPQQAQLNANMHDLKAHYKNITSEKPGGRSLALGSPGGSATENAHLIGSYCLNKQISTMLAELERLNKSKADLELRINELTDIQDKIDELKIMEETKSWEEISNIALKLGINLEGQIQNIAYIINRRSQVLPSLPGLSIESLILKVYSAVSAGWRPPNTKYNLKIPRGRTHVQMTSNNFIQKNSNLTALTDPWTYVGSLLYATTVITTIGYGNIVPKTNMGKMTTIIYGLFGIPIMLLYLANLGSLMADLFRITYKKLCLCKKSKQTFPLPEPRPLRPNESSRSHRALATHASDGNITVMRAATNTSSPALLRDRPGRVVKRPPPYTLQHLARKTTLPGTTDSLFMSLVGTNSVFTRAMRARQESRNVNVPIWLTLVIFFVYLLSGAAAFSHWEGWSFTDAVYFVFVTISTIGFGDIMPGMGDVDSYEQAQKFFAAIGYLLIGLALVCMCFDLMQRELKRKSKRVAQRIGLVDSR